MLPGTGVTAAETKVIELEVCEATVPIRTNAPAVTLYTLSN